MSHHYLACFGIALGLGGLCLSGEVTMPVRAVVQDALRPGLQAWELAAKSSNAWATRSKAIAGRQPDLRATESRLRQARQQSTRLELEVAKLREQLDESRRQQFGTAWQPTERLVTVRLVEARVFGRQTHEQDSAALLLARGLADQIAESALALGESERLVDVGEDHAVAAPQRVAAGGVVVGTIRRTNRLTSVLCPITDREFRAAARVARKSPQGLDLASRGTLVGVGSGCTLEHVSASEAVSVGDLIVTDDRENLGLPPQLYGEVVSAEVLPGQLVWTIEVSPACREIPAVVQIVQPVISPTRMAAK